MPWGVTLRLGLIQHIRNTTIIHLVFRPRRFTEKTRQVGLVSAIEDAIGDVSQALVFQHDQARQVVLKMAECTLILTEVAESVGMRLHHRSRGHDGQRHDPLSYLAAIQVGKFDLILYRFEVEGKSQQSRKHDLRA